MRVRAFAARNRKELLRNPLMLGLSLGFPVFMLALLSLLGRSVPADVPMFAPERLSPGIVLFSFGFFSLSVALLLAQDRSGAFLVRLQSSPLRPTDFFLGYALPALPVAMLQAVVCFAAAFCFGLKPGFEVLAALLTFLPTAVLFLSFGFIFGSLLSDRAVGGVASIFLNAATIAGGVWFPLDDMKDTVFYRVCDALPFLHCVKAASCALASDWSGMWENLLYTVPWTVGIAAIAVFLFRRTMRASR